MAKTVGTAFVGAAIATLLAWLSPGIAWGLPPHWTNPDDLAADKELRGYAITLEMLLISSQPHRAELKTLSERINNCRIWPNDAIALVEPVIKDRQTALEGLQNNVPPDPGVELLQLAFSAYTTSIRADNDLIAWLNQLKSAYPGELPCHHLHDPEYKQFVDDSALATASKEKFVAVFNPMAQRFGFAPPTWDASQF
jgi:hypothetical protein